MQNSRVLKPVDDPPMWSVVCLFIVKNFHRQGRSAKLLQAAAKHVKQMGGAIVEGYPVDPKGSPPDSWVWTGLAGSFREAGFEEVERRSPTRPIMRYVIPRRRRKQG